MLTSETKRRIDACRDVLVGKLPLPTDQVELITLALIYKFMDDLDEESVKLGGKRSYFTGELAKFRWRNLMPQTVSAEDRMTLFADGIEALGNAKKAAHIPALFRDIFRNAFLKFRDGRILTMFLTEINCFEYSHSEELGNAFEYLLLSMGTQGENGQFRTPRHIIDFIVACLEPKPGDRILDPACGTGGFLVSAYKHILAANTTPGSDVLGDNLTHAQRQKVYTNLTGYDTTDLMVKLSKVNLFLHGFPDPAIHIYDTLSNDARWHEKADLILANPPFMTPKGGVTPHTKFRIAARKAEVLFTDYIAEHLAADGRGGVIVPDGIVATKQTAYVKLRRFLLEDSLVAVLSLPAGVFKPYSGVKTSILFLDKNLARQSKEILFLKVTADGFDLGDKRTPIEDNHLPDAERIVKLWFSGKLTKAVETLVPWETVDKKGILESKGVSLQPEPYLGEGPPIGNGSFVKIVDLLCKVKSTNKIQKTQFLPTGRFPIIDQSENFIAGYWNDEADVFRVSQPLILFGDHTRRFKYVDFDFVLGADGVKVLQFDERVLPRYVYFALRALKLRNLGYSRHYKELLGHEIPLPPLDEQRRIASEIDALQKILDGAHQILENYTPRFDADADWPLVELRDLVSLSSGGTPDKGTDAYWVGSIPWVSAKDMKRPRLSDAQLHISESAIRETATELAPKGSVLILVRGMGLANGVPICELLVPCAFNQDIKSMIPRKNISAAYLAAALRMEDVQLKKAITTAAHGTLKIETDRLLEIRIPVPPMPLQQRIVTELDAEAEQIETVRNLIPRIEDKIQRVLDRVWGDKSAADELEPV